MSAEANAVPADVVAFPDPLSLLDDADPRLARNKRLVFDMWRSIVNAGHTELADEMLQPGYIQHSPVLPTGREAFKTIFSVVPRSEIPATVAPPLVTILAEGDLVVMALLEPLSEPDGSGTYATTHFNLFRVEDERLAEHWHSVQDAPGANLPPPDRGGPQRVTGATGDARSELLRAATPELAANKRLAFEAMLKLADSSAEARRYFAERYTEHSPAWSERRGGGAAGPFDAPLVAVVAQGDLVVLVSAREHDDPRRSGETYTTTWFDMFRIENGLIAEHWDGSVKPGTPMPKYS